MTMGIGPLLPPTGGGPGAVNSVEEARAQADAQTARQSGQTAAANAAADQPTTKLETAKAVQPTPAAAAAAKVQLDAERIAEGIVEYPITGPDLFVHAATSQAIQAADEARATEEGAVDDAQKALENEPPAPVSAPLPEAEIADTDAARMGEPATQFIDAPAEPVIDTQPAAEPEAEPPAEPGAEAA